MIKLIRGFHDILPEEAPKWEFLTSTARDTLKLFGYREIVPPILERSELFERGIGESTDIVEKEMYKFEDRNGDLVSLRPEATAGILRAVVEHSMLKKEPVLKLFAIGPMFRRERPSKGRYRQFFQINAELLGEDSPYSDAEVISVAHAIMTRVGADGLIMEVNSVGCNVCRQEYRNALQGFLRDYLDELCPDCKRRLDRNPLRVLDCKVERCSEIVRDAPLISDYLDEECREHFDHVRRALDILQVPNRVEPRMVRGLDYYTRTAFEIVHEELGRSKAVGGGGRYDNLVAELGGPEVGGMGFAIGLERLAMGFDDNDPRFARSIDVYVAALGDRATDPALSLIGQLRAAGFSAETRHGSKSLKAHMKQADKLGAAKVLMLGADELDRNVVTVRDMKTKDQTQAPLAEIVGFLHNSD